MRSGGDRSICVIFNATAGRSRARGRFETLRRACGDRIEFWPTERAGHAIQLARQAAEQGFEVVAAAGGDGTVHEVANGLLQAERPEVRFAVLPIGSANDYADSLEKSREGGDSWVRADVGRLRTGDGKTRYFVCCLGIGFSGNVTAESRRIRRLQGAALYGVAALRAMRHRWQHLDLVARLDEETTIAEPTLLVSCMIGRREGGFVMAPSSRVDDGWLEVVHVGRLSRWEGLRLLAVLAVSGPPKAHPRVRYERCRHLVIESRQPLAVHADGEIVCRPEENVRRLEVELLPGRLWVQLGLHGATY